MSKGLSNTWLGKTKQVWKIKALFILLIMDFFIFGLMVWKVNFPESAIFDTLNFMEHEISVFFVVATVIVFLWLIFSIKCPSCKRSTTAFFVNNASVNNWVYELFLLEKCPYCGFKPENS